MSTVLVTGGAGVLGSQLAPRLAQAGYTVRGMSRRPRPAAVREDVQWVQADLAAGEGLDPAVDGADVIIHAASNPRKQLWQTDVEGTRRLVQAAAAAGGAHVFYVSIVGIERIPLGYYRAKLAAERIVQESGLPWSILRATQFHTLIDMLLRALVRLPVAVLPADLKFQPVDAGEVAQRVVDSVGQGPRGRLPDMGGPSIERLGELARPWLKATGRRALVLPLPLPGKAAAGFRRGYNCAPAHAEGRITWEQWLRQQYAR